MIVYRRREKIMLNRRSIAVTMAPVMLLAGCATGTQNRGLESAHQPVVNRTDFVFDMNTDDAGLAPGELQRLSGWLASLRLGYGDKVALDDPARIGGNARADIGTIVQRYGLFLADQPLLSQTPSTPGTVRVVVSRMRATVPDCPDYSRSGPSNFNNHTSSNYGCAINSNLAAMVARPEDLVRGQPGSDTSDPATGTRAIQALRQGTSAGGAAAGGGTAAGGGGSSAAAASGGGDN